MKGYLLSSIQPDAVEEADIYRTAFISPTMSGIHQSAGLIGDAGIEEASNGLAVGGAGTLVGAAADSARVSRLYRGAGRIHRTRGASPSSYFVWELLTLLRAAMLPAKAKRKIAT